MSHVNTSYKGSLLVQSLNIFVPVSGNPQLNTSAFGGNGKSGRNQQEQCIAWIPLQCGIPVAKRANSYSGAMVMTYKTGESPSNGAPPKVDTISEGLNNKKRSHTQLDSRKQVIAFQDRVITINIKEAQHPLK